MSSISNLTVLRLLVISSCCFILALAGPRYIAIPIDGVDVIELNPISSPSIPGGSRFARNADNYPPIPVSALQHAPEPIIDPPMQVRSERATAHILDYVDFGGHTGSNGAFSWYADYPSHH